MKCPNCGAEASGKFCATCGASLTAANCTNCGAALTPGARFCNQCGRAVGRAAGQRRPVAPTAGASSNLPWYLLAVVLVGIIIVLLVPMLRGDGGNGGAVPVPLGAGNDAGAPPPLTGTPREQADRLFNRIMTAQSEGDTTNARFFAPMAIDAYNMAEPLDHDGLYHLATIQNVKGDYAAGRATAERILGENPNHLLGLAAAGEAAERAGDATAARNYYQRLIAAYEKESARDLREYRDHARILPEYLATARRVTGG